MKVRESTLQLMVQARFLVAGLGEMAAPPWWRSQATGPVGQGMRAHVFPRTVLTASFETASRAARIEHDARIGRLGGYHLFRLPVVNEAAVRDLLRSGVAREVLQRLEGVTSFEERMQALDELASDTAMPPARGPVQIGSIGDLWRGRTVGRICGMYHAAFQSGSPVYPYLEGSAR